jgi:hypothetical protein
MYNNLSDRKTLALSMLSKIEYKENDFYDSNFLLKPDIQVYSMLYEMSSQAEVLMPQYMGYSNPLRIRKLVNAGEISDFLTIPEDNIKKYEDEMIYFSNIESCKAQLRKNGGMKRFKKTKKTKKRKFRMFKKTRRSIKKGKKHLINKDKLTKKI